MMANEPCCRGIACVCVQYDVGTAPDAPLEPALLPSSSPPPPEAVQPLWAGAGCCKTTGWDILHLAEDFFFFFLLLRCSAAKISIPGFQELLCQLYKEPS